MGRLTPPLQRGGPMNQTEVVVLLAGRGSCLSPSLPSLGESSRQKTMQGFMYISYFVYSCRPVSQASEEDSFDVLCLCGLFALPCQECWATSAPQHCGINLVLLERWSPVITCVGRLARKLNLVFLCQLYVNACYVVLMQLCSPMQFLCSPMQQPTFPLRESLLYLGNKQKKFILKLYQFG